MEQLINELKSLIGNHDENQKEFIKVQERIEDLKKFREIKSAFYVTSNSGKVRVDLEIDDIDVLINYNTELLGNIKAAIEHYELIFIQDLFINIQSYLERENTDLETVLDSNMIKLMMLSMIGSSLVEYNKYSTTDIITSSTVKDPIITFSVAKDNKKIERVFDATTNFNIVPMLLRDAIIKIKERQTNK